MPLQAPTIRIRGTTATFVAEPGADVLYTTDGREPTSQSFIAPRDGPVELGQRHLVLKAVAVRDTERSAVATTMYVYTPRPLMIHPDDGVYDGEVLVHFQSDHDDIHYTTDGSVPSSNSLSYEGPFTLNLEGAVVVTAGMFVGDRLVGGIARRTYEIAQARLEAPAIEPQSGTYLVPLRIALSSVENHDIRYTLDGSEPTTSSSRYTAPIVLLQEGDVTLTTRCYPRSSAAAANRRPSDAVVAQYHLTYTLAADDADRGQSNTHPVTVLPVSNLEFDEIDKHLAGDTAERTVALSRAAEQVKREVRDENDGLRNQLSESKREHKGLLAQLDAIRKELGIAAARKSLLQANMATQADAAAKTQERLAELEEEQLLAKQRLFSTNVEVAEAESLLRQTTSEHQTIHTQMTTLRTGLEAAYLKNKKELADTDPTSLDLAVAETTAVIAEQRHELWLLRETIAELHKSLEPQSTSAAEFVPQGKAVALSMVEVTIPIPRGKMRLITGAAGTGLHKLREAHKVQAQIVPQNDGLCVRVFGHANGVHNLMEHVGRLLNE